MTTRIPTRSRATQQKLVEQKRGIFYSNLLLLEFTPDILAQEKFTIHKDMFAASGVVGKPPAGPKVTEKVLWFLFDKLDREETRKRFKESWPVEDRKQARDFRNVAFKWLEQLKKDGLICVGYPVRRSYLDEGRGERFENILFSLSNHILRTVMEKDAKLRPKSKSALGSSTNISISNLAPSVSSINSDALRRLGTDTLKKTLKHHIKKQIDTFLSNAQERVKIQEHWSENSRSLTASFEEIVTEQEELNKLKLRLSQKDIQPVLSIESPLAKSEKVRVQQARDSWEKSIGWIEENYKQMESINNMLTNFESKPRLEGSLSAFNLPTPVFQLLEEDVRNLNPYFQNNVNPFKDRRLDLIAMMKLWRMSIEVMGHTFGSKGNGGNQSLLLPNSKAMSTSKISQFPDLSRLLQQAEPSVSKQIQQLRSIITLKQSLQTQLTECKEYVSEARQRPEPQNPLIDKQAWMKQFNIGGSKIPSDLASLEARNRRTLNLQPLISLREEHRTSNEDRRQEIREKVRKFLEDEYNKERELSDLAAGTTLLATRAESSSNSHTRRIPIQGLDILLDQLTQSLMESTDSSKSFDQSQYSGEGTSASAATSTFSPSADSFLALLNEENPDIERLLSTDIGTPDLTVSNSPADSSLHGAEELSDISFQTGLAPNEQEGHDPDNLSHSELSDEEFEIPGAVSRWMTAAQASGGNLTGQENFPENWEDVDSAIQEFRNDLKVSTGIGKVKREGKRGRTRKDPNLTPEIQRMLGEANLLYVEKKYTEAISTLQEIIRLSPNVHKAWFTLGMIQEELGNEDKALQLYLVAAHLTLKDGALWKRLGLMSKKQGAIQQAIYCFSRAISADYHDVDAIWDRSFLYADSGQLRKAIEGYKSILQYVPYHMNVIRELTRIYIQINDLNSAISFFEEALSHYLQRESPQSIHSPITLNNAADIFGFDYSDLNIMVELYMMMGDFEKAIKSLKRGVRKLHGRDKEVWWDTVEDDREFDDTPNSSIAPILPLELRAKLGECRLMLGQVDQAKIHFRYLFSNSIEKYADLYHEVAETYMEKRMFEEALAVYEEIINHEVVWFRVITNEVMFTDGPIAWVQMAICHRELGNLDSAVELYTAAVEAIPEDLDNKIALAEIYEELGEEERALELVIEVDEARKAARTLASLSENKEQEPEAIENPAINNFSIFNVESSRWEALKAKNAATRAARLQQEQEAERDTKIKFQKLGLLMSRLAIDEKARMKRFTGFRDRVKWATLDEQVRFMVARLKHSTATDGSQFNTNPPRLGSQANGVNESEDEKTIPTSFRSFSFEEWFDMFVKYAMTLANFNRQEEAYDLLKTVGEANVYYHHEPTKIAIKMIVLDSNGMPSTAIALHCHNNEKACEVARWLCSYHPFHDNSYKMYSAAMSSGTSATSVYASANSQKYFLRQIKAMDSNVDGSRVLQPNLQTTPNTTDLKESGKDGPAINKRNPLLLTLYGHILHCARSYVPAIGKLPHKQVSNKLFETQQNFLGYYTRAYTLSPDDPLISLSLGLAYIHRAMQRQTDNRHLQIMQKSMAGLSIGTNGAEIDQEDDPTDLSREAAYNLANIYTSFTYRVATLELGFEDFYI
ncbi:hypothetical protein K493DRAFT_297630 [Basidiobolus meristosporus CBS 931.73]|uniref:HAUS augmin-like complex subunit 6 N-terminal domain-containing protein n=1 Tax=Basidiobolus meristosporus CBS 931.73 TaxID=1314790 RepID=A0A1Y1YY87_9FUNG|nr:hypothetical protein K493DRAFT_297630 [Basidiobolus meristosporus CBS 931.73]|eukprot:ORY02982.1 hypothetical protein K493DRAFT_297630 [Basidiobolus meristosporus CBS 931.73]